MAERVAKQKKSRADVATESDSAVPHSQSRAAFFAGLLFFLLVVVGLYWTGLTVAQWLTDQKRLPMSELIVLGERQYVSDDEVRQVLLAIPDSQNFFTLDVAQLQENLESLPWVYSASIRKRWPDRLKVFLQEQTVSAYWNEEDLLNKQGEVFNAPQDKITEQLVYLYGPNQSSVEVLEVYKQLESLLMLNGFNIEALELTHRYAWNIQLKQGIELKLGREQRVDRVQRFIDIYPLLDAEKVAYVDLRYDTGVAVGWKPKREPDDQSNG
ncbi:cell division protein FtsQ/DivIB [Motilimonas cestriensis]|uniref:Cell division protein FtsQ n=1 Tax=Motilimonas cestriensis TaxID=2742685 RepID=A0ABS8WAN7_9GAMM|nr:cell division protein FtsQ/DivIB [Motilimonas cestriensis]